MRQPCLPFAGGNARQDSAGDAPLPRATPAHARPPRVRRDDVLVAHVDIFVAVVVAAQVAAQLIKNGSIEYPQNQGVQPVQVLQGGTCGHRKAFVPVIDINRVARQQQ